MSMMAEEDQSFKGLIDHLHDAFQSGKTLSELISDFYGQSQKARETKDTFTNDLQVLARKIIVHKPSFRKEANQQLKAQYAHKLQDQYYAAMENVLRSLSSQGILAQDKIEIIQQAVAKCPKISISSMGVQIPSLLDSGSKVSLIHYSHFKEHLLPKIEDPMGEKSEAHVLFNLTAANDGQLPVKKYIELD